MGAKHVFPVLIKTTWSQEEIKWKQVVSARAGLFPALGLCLEWEAGGHQPCQEEPGTAITFFSELCQLFLQAGNVVSLQVTIKLEQSYRFRLEMGRGEQPITGEDLLQQPLQHCREQGGGQTETSRLVTWELLKTSERFGVL